MVLRFRHGSLRDRFEHLRSRRVRRASAQEAVLNRHKVKAPEAPGGGGGGGGAGGAAAGAGRTGC